MPKSESWTLPSSKVVRVKTRSQNILSVGFPIVPCIFSRFLIFETNLFFSQATNGPSGTSASVAFKNPSSAKPSVVHQASLIRSRLPLESFADHRRVPRPWIARELKTGRVSVSWYCTALPCASIVLIHLFFFSKSQYTSLSSPAAPMSKHVRPIIVRTKSPASQSIPRNGPQCAPLRSKL